MRSTRVNIQRSNIKISVYNGGFYDKLFMTHIGFPLKKQWTRRVPLGTSQNQLLWIECKSLCHRSEEPCLQHTVTTTAHESARILHESNRSNAGSYNLSLGLPCAYRIKEALVGSSPIYVRKWWYQRYKATLGHQKSGWKRRYGPSYTPYTWVHRPQLAQG